MSATGGLQAISMSQCQYPLVVKELKILTFLGWGFENPGAFYHQGAI